METLWFLYEKQFDVAPPKIPWAMAKHAIPLGISFDIKYIEYFSIINNELRYKDITVSELPKVILFRGYNLELCTYFERKGVRVINNSFAMRVCKDKYECYELIKKLNITQPQTYSFNINNVTYNDISKLLGNTFIVKDRYGMKGENVFLIQNEISYNIMIKKLNCKEVIFQEFITESSGKDVRVYVVGNQVIGAILRYNDQDFRANIAQGGNFENYPVSNDLLNNSLNIAKALKAEIVSIDFLIGKKGLVFCEANSNAGFKAFNRLGFPMTECIVQYVYSVINEMTIK